MFLEVHIFDTFALILNSLNPRGNCSNPVCIFKFQPGSNFVYISGEFETCLIQIYVFYMSEIGVH